jgi:hypothetical protein
MIKRGSTVAFGIVAGLGLTAGAAIAADAPKTAVLLRTATVLAYEAPNGPADKPVRRLSGAGVMDVKPAFRKIANPDGTFKVRVGALVTVSAAQANNNNSYMQGGLYLGDLTKTGLQTVTAMKMFPELQGDRPFMRPMLSFAQAQNFAVTIMATEDNGNNNNPQAAAYVVDLDGKLLDIANSTRDSQDKPTNLIELSGKQDGQQWGPHSICSLGADGTGESFLLGVQRNNQAAYVMKVKVEPATNGAVNVTVPYLRRMVDEAQHCRPQITCPAPGTTDAYVTSVEANNQPADIGIRLVKFNVTTGDKIASKLIAESDPDGNNNNGRKTYAVQNSAMMPLENGLGAVAYQMSAKARRDGGDGHTGGENLSMLATVKLADLSVVKTASRVAPYQRHAFSYATVFGEGAGKPAIAAMGGSSTGTGKGLIQIVSADGVGTPTVDPTQLFEVSKYSDVANLPARGKRNPNNQGAGFLNGIGGVENPGYKDPTGFMPEVHTFFLSALPGYKEIPASNRESLWVSLIPSTWDPAITPVPGPVTENVPPGPSPRVSAPPAQPQGGTDAFGNPIGSSSDGTGTPKLDNNSGCSCDTAGRSSSSTGMAGAFALALGLLLSARRTRRSAQ